MKTFTTAYLLTLFTLAPATTLNPKDLFARELASLNMPPGYGKITPSKPLDKRDCVYSAQECSSKMGPMPVCTGTENGDTSSYCCESDWCDSGYMACSPAGNPGAGFAQILGEACLCIRPC